MNNPLPTEQSVDYLEEYAVTQVETMLSVLWTDAQSNRVAVQKPFDTQDPTLRQIVRLAHAQGMRVEINFLPLDSAEETR